MGELLVARSYQGLPQVSEEYSINGRTYVKVRTKTGAIKQVRTYTQKEYDKYNPPVKIIQPAKSQREIFGFGKKGFIWVFKGNTYSALTFFKQSPCRYAKFLGWYLPSDIEMPDPLPVEIKPVKLQWEDVCNEEGNHFKAEEDVRAHVDTLVYDIGKSQWIGEKGKKLTIHANCTKVFHFMNSYGDSSLFQFEDKDGNIFTWTTKSSPEIMESCNYEITGVVKDHITYRANKQTTLSRCKVVEETEE